ncbi:hypothetical protein IQ247_03235 [Plectonema cf. radiosum LEGE 06105]|uniref:Uncharacterized protein n=1 Tax=Plectonema cf. radiosum LEGE 06105 TaxID=945769 RepID=A0A8J7JRU6_9CYAN|nr:hypothetical protein [Plectonema radiosum]MBE9211739.1 hypothetical protein [Plectonema cf. radiosum LEGE 06105]
MKVIKLEAVVNDSGILHLDIPTELSSGTVDVVVVLNPSIPDTLQAKTYDFSDLAGRLSWQGDSITQTRILRDEW